MTKTKKGVVVFDDTEPLKEVSHFRGNIKIVLCSIKISNTIIVERCTDQRRNDMFEFIKPPAMESAYITTFIQGMRKQTRM